MAATAHASCSVGVLGAAGAVGSATAFALALDGAARRLLLVDRDAPLLAAHHADLSALAAALRGRRVERAPLAALAGCDVVVACAGPSHRDGAPRSAFLAAGAAVVAELADALGGESWGGTVLVVTNPVDPLTTWLARRLGGRARAIGYTLNDELRLRAALAGALGRTAAPAAWVAGEHGPHAVPLLSRVEQDGAPVALGARARATVLADVRGWYDRWQRLGTGRTAVWSTAWGAAALVRALLCGDERVWSASALLAGEYGVDGVCLGVPVVLGPGRVAVQEWPLEPAERAGIAAAARVVAAAVAQIEQGAVAA